MGSKFCPECGAKVEPLKPTPPRSEIFTDIRKIEVAVGTKIKIITSETNETTVIVDGPEEVKQGLTMELQNGVLEIHGPPDPVNVSINSFGGQGTFISGNLIINQGTRNVVINGNNISGVNAPVSVTITTPTDVEIVVDTVGDLNFEVGEFSGKISIDTAGNLTFNAGLIVNFDADV